VSVPLELARRNDLGNPPPETGGLCRKRVGWTENLQLQPCSRGGAGGPKLRARSTPRRGLSVLCWAPAVPQRGSCASCTALDGGAQQARCCKASHGLARGFARAGPFWASIKRGGCLQRHIPASCGRTPTARPRPCRLESQPPLPKAKAHGGCPRRGAGARRADHHYSAQYAGVPVLRAAAVKCMESAAVKCMESWAEVLKPRRPAPAPRAGAGAADAARARCAGPASALQARICCRMQRASSGSVGARARARARVRVRVRARSRVRVCASFVVASASGG
jgi:hypothetical protein